MILVYGWSWAERLGTDEVISSVERVLRALGYEVTRWEGEVPFAEMIGEMGYTGEMLDVAREIADGVRGFAEGHEITAAVTPFSHIYHAWREVLPENGVEFPFPMEHVTTFLRGKLAGVKMREVRKRVLLHDAHLLGRWSRLGDAPREILGHVPGLEVVEFTHPEMEVRDLAPWDIAPCPGGWLSLALPELMPHIAANVIRRSVLPAEVDAVVTTCALPYHAFRVGREFGSYPVEVAFLTEILEQAMGVRGGE